MEHAGLIVLLTVSVLASRIRNIIVVSTVGESCDI
jgi:hypothetical protein